MPLSSDPSDRNASSAGSSGFGWEDHVSVGDLIYAYAWHFDRNEPEAIAALFTDDGVIDYGPEVPDLVGPENILEVLESNMNERFAASSHHVSNMRITPAGDSEADACAYVYSWCKYRSGAPDSYLWAQYHTRSRRTPAGWKMVRLELRAAGSRDFHRRELYPIGRREPA